jgi:hemerythrin superfamily protein
VRSKARRRVVSAIEFLKRQHREVEQLFEQLKVSDDERERVQLLGRLAEALTLHAVLEERHFYPLCRRAGLEEEANRSVEEHAQVKALVARTLQHTRRDPQLLPTVERLQEAVEAHVEEEETELFPKVEAGADEDALQQVGDELEADMPGLRESNLLEEADAAPPSA